MDSSKDEHWSSQITFIIATIGSAVGVGNIWRFPYLVGLYGGGTFILAYLISIVVFGIPVLYLELFAGKHFAMPAIKIFQKINKKAAAIFWLPFTLNFIVLSFYIVVTGWTLYYFVSSLTGTELSFHKFTTTNLPILFDIIIAAILLAVLRKNIKNGIEKISLFLMPLFFLCLILLFISSVQLSGFNKAVDFYLSFEPIKFLDVSLWIAAISQVIFSLGVGYIILLTYGGYVEKKTNIGQSTIITALADTGISLIGALAILSIVFTFNLDPSSGMSLSFEALPVAFGTMPFGNVMMPIFFFLLFAAAITSAIGMAEVVVNTLEARFKIDRKNAALLCMIVVLVCSLPSALSYSEYTFELFGKPFFNFLNEDIVSFISPLAILSTVAILAYSKDLYGAIKQPVLMILLRYIVPAFLLLIFVRNLIR